MGLQKKSKIITGTILNEKLLGNVSDFSVFAEFFNNQEYTIFPGFCDVHVHFREPGFCYKETILSGTVAAAHGGYTAVCTMPNLKPVPCSKESLEIELSLVKKDAVIGVYPYGSITVDEMGERLSNFLEMKENVIAFSDDGKGVQNAEMMESAMLKAKSLDKIIVAHCEDNSLIFGGYIHDGIYAKEHGHKGISSESEYKQIERDLVLAKKTGVKYHICHISTKESVELIRKAKKDGVDVTCETAPHYILLDESDLKESGDYKMNPPLRSKEDRLAILEGVVDGTIDMIATDHAPHSEEEKSRGLKDSLFGIVGIETAFPLLYTNLVKNGVLSIEKLIDLLSINPRTRFNIPYNGFCVWNLNSQYEINKKFFLSKGKSSPFIGQKVYGKNMLTVYNGKAIYKK